MLTHSNIGICALSRRGFLGRAIAFGASGLLTGVIWPPRPSVAAVDNSDPTFASVLRELYGNSEIVTDSRVQIDVPERVEDGANVPLTVDADVKNADSLSVLVTKNPRALAAQFEFSGALIYLRTRIKVAESSNIHAVLRSKNGLLLNTRYVTLASGTGGCSGSGVPERPIPRSQIGEIKTRIVRKAGHKEFKCLIRHPMETGFRKDAKTKRAIPAHYINWLEVRLNGTAIISAMLGSAISRNPLFVFAYPVTEKHDEIVVSWKDTEGLSGSSKTVEKA